MKIEDILLFSDGNQELEVTFDPLTLETTIGNLKMSKDDLIRLTSFLDSAINAKIIKEKKNNSVITKILNKIGREEADKNVLVSYV